jgi:DNA polymerase-4
MLSEMIGRRARKYGYMGKTVSLMVRYTDFETFSKQTTLSDFTNDTHAIFQATLKIINTIRLKDKVRLLGASLSQLIKDLDQIPLIEEERKRRHIIGAIDYINDTYGDFKITWGSYIQQKRSSGVISPAWRPSGVKNITVK